mmetsp:Transcript_14904/g.25292  ORF Transcript_14904/g.25292 Transcript_14904/m.25292 type:complete len:88 (-) Transcript_14904:392-655(-)
MSFTLFAPTTRGKFDEFLRAAPTPTEKENANAWDLLPTVADDGLYCVAALPELLPVLQPFLPRSRCPPFQQDQMDSNFQHPVQTTHN